MLAPVKLRIAKNPGCFMHSHNHQPRSIETLRALSFSETGPAARAEQTHIHNPFPIKKHLTEVGGWYELISVDRLALKQFWNARRACGRY